MQGKKIKKKSLSSSQSKPTPSYFPYIGSEISLCPSTVHAVSWPDCWGDPLFPSIPSQVPPLPLKTSFLYYTLFCLFIFFSHFFGERSGCVATGDEKYQPCPPPWPEIVRGKSRHHRIFFSVLSRYFFFFFCRMERRVPLLVRYLPHSPNCNQAKIS